MTYKRKNLKDNRLKLQKPIRRISLKKLEYQMSDDYLISIVENYSNNGTIKPSTVTINHNFSFIEPKDICRAPA